MNENHHLEIFWKKIDSFVFLSLARTKVKSTQFKMLFLFRLHIILFIYILVVYFTKLRKCELKKSIWIDKHSIGISFFRIILKHFLLLEFSIFAFFLLFAYRSLDWYHIEIWLYLADAIYGIRSIFIECVNVSHQFR